MDTWSLLIKELEYHGITVVDRTKCQISDDNGSKKTKGIIRAIRDIKSDINGCKKILLSIWDEMINLLSTQQANSDILDDRMVDLFIFSLKDMIKYLLCFDGAEQSKYYRSISAALCRDINSFGKNQICSIPDYKMAIDWISRVINRLLYVSNLLACVSLGQKKMAKYDTKTASGISGPWSRLDLPMEERMFPFGDEVQQREKGKRGQRRYRKGLENYNGDGRVGEGHYWRELRNEPFSWFDRGTEDPYPSRSMLSGRG